jgi:molybdopterin-guanine dinucleotide biosynthesis protein A
MQDVLKDFEDPGACRALVEVTGVVLAGGKSSRYGRNKAFDVLEGVPLIERVIGVMRPIFQKLILSTNSPESYEHLNLPMETDLFKGLGPLGGIHTALSIIETETCFVVACDMPFLNSGLIRYMVDTRNDFDVVVPRIQGMMEALHAVYHKRCLPAIRDMIEAKRYQIFRFFPSVSVRFVEEAEIRRFDPNLKSFLNVNRPEELKKFETGLQD